MLEGGGSEEERRKTHTRDRLHFFYFPSCRAIALMLQPTFSA